MAVLAIKKGARCKLCLSPRLDEMNVLLEMRSKGQSDAAGTRVNFDYVAERYAEWHDGAKLSEDNVKGHWKNHCQVVEAETIEQRAEAEERARERAVEVFERILGPGWEERETTADERLRIVGELGLLELYEAVRNGDPIAGITERILKQADSATRRRQEESTALLLRTLGAGMGAALGAAAEKRALPAAEVVEDGEVEEVG